VSLIGPWFVTVTAAVAVLAFCAAVRWWPRWSGPGPRAVASRAAVLGGVNVIMLLTAAVVLNNMFAFFADWNDLVGATGHSAVTTRGGADAGAAVDQPVSATPTTNAANGYGPAGTPAGTAVDTSIVGTGTAAPLPPLPAGLVAAHPVHTFTITGARSRVRAQVLVELPPDYFDPTQAHRRFPVIETFHGYPGRPNQWVAGMELGTTLAQEGAAHHIGEAIIVSPDLEYPAGVDTECVDGGAAGPAMETWASQDVPDWVMATFRTRPERQSWATIGLSAGGWCAALVTMHHPERFSAGIVLAGYFRPEFSRYVPFRPDSPAGRDDDLVRLASTAPPPVALWLQTSKVDQISYATSKELIAAARPPLAVQSTVLANAGHRFSLWRGLLPQALQWLGHTVPGFAP
jgi:enterochelin esterase-like enzyme